MTRVSWGDPGTRIYEAGVDRGMLYVGDNDGVPWSGLVSVSEKASGGAARPFYMDGVKYLNISSAEEFEGTIEAYTYPDAFGVCDGSISVRTGFYAKHQRRKSFHLSYRTMIGNDIDGVTYGYKIHLIYNALAAPATRENTTIDNSADPMNFQWDITTTPQVMSGYTPTAHMVLDSREVAPLYLSAIEDILYGDDSDDPRMPTFAELISIFDEGAGSLVVTDLGGEKYSILGPDDAVVIDGDTVTITWDTVVPNGLNSYLISSS